MSFSALSIVIGWVVLPLLLTFPRYRRFGAKSALSFGFAKSSKYKPIFPLSQMPKSVVVAVIGSSFRRSFYQSFHLLFFVNSLIVCFVVERGFVSSDFNCRLITCIIQLSKSPTNPSFELIVV